MDFPHVFVFEEPHEDDSAMELARVVAELGIRKPLVLSNVHGRRLCARLPSPVALEAHRPEANQGRAAELGSSAQRSGADAVIAVGGGRCLDVAKLAAARAGVVMVAAPTQLSHDGLCSPVAVVPDQSGKKESLGAIAPTAVFVSLPTLVGAPAASVAAGIGDLLANPLALKDWRLAAERGLEDIDERAWDLSEQSYSLIRDDLDRDPTASARDPGFLRRLADALVLSGKAMICSGSSRPASGGEHEISHAIDELHGGRALHGAQVAFGCIVSVELYGQDTDEFREMLRRLGLPQDPSELDLSLDDVTRLLLEAPSTRPGRFTILEHANLDESSARELVKRIWK